MTTTGYKFVAVLNKKIEPGKALNALGHMTAGLAGIYENKEELEIINYEDKDGGAHSASKHPFIVLKAKNSNKIRDFRNKLIEKDIPFASFTEAMTIGTWEEQVARSKNTPEEELEYYGICTFGKPGEIDELTKKFSLWQ